MLADWLLSSFVRSSISSIWSVLSRGRKSLSDMTADVRKWRGVCMKNELVLLWRAHRLDRESRSKVVELKSS